ncbi:hypothetical protein ASG47_09100 [Devosia sp. Leaf420]|uniref:hypothetical protein n=1 Tax=Devosia sp. Leaf420 TaxID=1736374 RepID=UPI000712E412|nr:hypothetical protein [Devosia sp. Leaf420]KQT48492.1 hypothetical protein ASG47_09100 [Devosia sp. Leaf420]
MISLDVPIFRDFAHLQKAIWAPVLFRPIMGSPEQFVIGIAVASDSGVHLERANQLQRLECIFSNASQMAIAIAETALNIIEADLSQRSKSALSEFRPGISGVLLGDINEAQGISLEQIAASWMSALSSLYDRNLTQSVTEDLPAVLEEAIAAREGGDRLPSLVFEYVRQHRQGLDRFFSNEIRSGTQRRRNAHAVVIDFAGSKLVANFGTLASSNFNASVGRIKTRLWELKVDRDKEPSAIAMRDHEMIVQHQSMNDPQLSFKQVDRLKDALSALEAQADQEEIRLRALTSVDEIGRHILHKEAA